MNRAAVRRRRANHTQGTIMRNLLKLGAALCGATALGLGTAQPAFARIRRRAKRLVLCDG